MNLAAVFLLSLSSLALEVLLTRVFSISQWNHLSFMVISIALFGFAAAGTFLNIMDTYKKMAQIKGISDEALTERVYTNFCRFFDLAVD